MLQSVFTLLKIESGGSVAALRLYISLLSVLCSVLLSSIGRIQKRLQKVLRNKLIIPVNVEIGEDQVADGEAEHGEGDGEAVEEAAGDLLVVQAGDHQLRVQTRVETREVPAQLSESCGECWR